VAYSGCPISEDEDRRRTQEASFDLHLLRPINRTKLLQVLAPVVNSIEARGIDYDPQ
jgi:hypothetical protein